MQLSCLNFRVQPIMGRLNFSLFNGYISACMTSVVSKWSQYNFLIFSWCIVKTFDTQCIWCDFLGLQLPSAVLSTGKLVRHYHWADWSKESVWDYQALWGKNSYQGKTALLLLFFINKLVYGRSKLMVSSTFNYQFPRNNKCEISQTMA